MICQQVKNGNLKTLLTILFNQFKSSEDGNLEILLYNTNFQLSNYFDKNIYNDTLVKSLNNLEVNMFTESNQEANKKSEDIIFENLKITRFICHAYINDSLIESRRHLAAMKKNSSMYVFTAKDLYYLSSYEHEAIKIELDNIIFAKLKLDLRAEILAVQKLDISIQPVDLNLEQLESLNVATSHIHPDASIQNQKISLFEILLTRGRLHNDWQDKRTENLARYYYC